MCFVCFGVDCCIEWRFESAKTRNQLCCYDKKQIKLNHPVGVKFQ